MGSVVPLRFLRRAWYLSFFLFTHHFFSVHHFSSSFIISPLRSSFLLFIRHFSSSNTSSFIIYPLRSSFLLFVHPFSFSFIIFPPLTISPLRSSLLLPNPRKHKHLTIFRKFNSNPSAKTPEISRILIKIPRRSRTPTIPELTISQEIPGFF